MWSETWIQKCKSKKQRWWWRTKKTDTWICLTWHDGGDWYKRSKRYKKVKEKKRGKRKASYQSKLLSLLQEAHLAKRWLAERNGVERKPFSLNLLFSLSSAISFVGLEMGCVDMRDNIMICTSKHKLLLWILCGRRRLCCSTNRMQVCKKVIWYARCMEENEWGW